MKLVHYSDALVGTLERRSVPSVDCFKPYGLWVSDDDCESNWREWCVREGFRLEHLTHVHDVTLAPGADVLILRSALDLDAFAREWAPQEKNPTLPGFTLRWSDIQARYAGLIITPYIWESRLDIGSAWYNFSWECAGGCIWDPSAIASITLREVVPIPEPVG